MKTKLNSVILFLFLATGLFGSTPEVSMNVYTFMASDKPYIEIALYVVGSSLAIDSTDDGHYGVQYTLTVQNKESQIVAAGKYNLQAQGKTTSDILDVRRFSIPPGEYVVKIEVVDMTDSLRTIEVEQPLEITQTPTTDRMSDLQLLSTIGPADTSHPDLNKSDLYMEPLAFHLYYPALKQLHLYHEIYHADQLAGQPYVQYTISPAKGDIPKEIVTYKKVKKESVVPTVFQLDISDLISGPFVLHARLFDGNKVLQSEKSVSFGRLNPTADSLYMENAALALEGGFATRIPTDSLDYCMRAIAPILSSQDVDVNNMLLEKGSEKAKRYFIHRFWTTMAEKHAQEAFQQYMQVAHVVDMNYRSGFGYGFETDRGHIFLKYGRPDDIIEVEDEPTAPPYEIWFYNSFPATHQANVRFLFYNPSLTKNGYQLLHSTAIGEVKNARWEIELYRDATQETPGVNAREMGDNVYRNARRYFEN